MGVSIASPYEVDRLLCLIEDVPDILIVTQESFTADDDNSLQDNKFYHATKSLSFEVRESGLAFHESLSMDETFNDILAYLKPLNNGDELKDFLGSTDLSVTEHFLSQDASEYDLEHIPLSLNSFLELNPINLSGSILLEKQSVMYPVISDGSSSHFPCSAQLEEVRIFDKVSVNVPDIFSNFETVKEDAFFEQMCKEEIGYMENFNELILSSELSLMDDTFILLPAPFLSDEKTLKSESMIVENIFNVLKSHSFSVCDELYLDWHPLFEGVCDNETCSTLISITQEVIGYRIDTSELNYQLENSMPPDFDFLNDSSGEVSRLQCKEELTNVHGSCPNTLVPTIDLDATEIANHELKESDDAKQMPKRNPAKVSSLLESNDLNFFLGVRKGNAEVYDCGASRANIPSSRSTSGDTLKEPSEPANLYEPDNEKIEIHKASLPGYTLGLIDQIQGIYFSNLKKCKHLISNSSFPTIKDCELLSIPKVKLLDLIAEKGGSHYTLGSTDEAFVALLAIFAVKQLVYYLCFFGFHIAYFYVSICSSKVDNLADRLQPLQSLLQDAHSKVEKQIIESHPSLPLIDSLLRSHTSGGYQKTLIISDELFWPSLKHKLTVLRLSFHKFTRPYCPAEQLDIQDSNRDQVSISDVLSTADCILLTYE
ncbi:hypothetical protein KSP40_PGU021111 [Platanthera guangdongensis]|uniref:Uncharacterized protein n=1 Tax=Platanthera guangdongensis TaxID=2320717 RepID=A0ABR2MRB2_9ASPA